MPRLLPISLAVPVRVALVLSLALLLLLTSGCGDKTEEKKASSTAKKKTEQQAQAPQPAPKVNVVVARAVAVPFLSEYSASLEAKESVEIRARVAGYLQDRHFEEGSNVDKGQLLFTIDPSQYEESLKEAQSQLARDKATLDKAKVDLRRFSQLYSSGAISREELDTRQTSVKELEATVEQDQAAVKQSQLDLGYTKIKAPLDGRIGRAQKQKGDLVGKGDNTLLATITSVDPIYANFNISESDYLRYVKRAQSEKTAPKVVPILVLSDGTIYKDHGAINMIDPTVDQQTGTIGVRSTFPNGHGLLRPGQFARVRLAVQRDGKAIIIPQQAVKDVQGMKTCLVSDKDGKVKSKSVTLGQELGALVVVLDGLEEGDLVLTEGLQKITPGEVIDPQKTKLDLKSIAQELGGGKEPEKEQQQEEQSGETLEKGAPDEPADSGGAQ